MITIIDYNAGNLRSVEKALQFIGTEVKVTGNLEEIYNSDAVILPGVGAYADCMNSLMEAGMVDVIHNVIKSGKPFLGICLGFQLLFEYSEEHAKEGEPVKGLGILKGCVKQIPKDMDLKVPHMGWNSLELSASSPLFQDLPDKPYVYFVHSFYAEAVDRDSVIARTRYGIDMDVAVWKGNLFATQFHPEKSGSIGLQMLRNFLKVVYKNDNISGN